MFLELFILIMFICQLQKSWQPALTGITTPIRNPSHKTQIWWNQLLYSHIYIYIYVSPLPPGLDITKVLLFPSIILILFIYMYRYIYICQILYSRICIHIIYIFCSPLPLGIDITKVLLFPSLRTLQINYEFVTLVRICLSIIAMLQ